MISLKKLTPYLFLFPALLLLTLTVFLPALQAFLLSFTQYNYDVTQTPQWIGFANFVRLWNEWNLDNSVLKIVIFNTFLYLIGVVPFLVFLPLGLAILVNQKLKGMQWFRTAYYTPVIISMVVAGLCWKALYMNNGLLNQALQAWGFSVKIPWLTSPNLALGSVMLVTIWKGLGYYMVVYLAGLQSIPEELYEAGAIDGSIGWKKHLDITIPLMRPYLFLVAVISSISATKVFEEVFVLTKGGPLNSSKTIVYYLYELISKDLDYSYACALGLILFLFIFVLSLINLYLRKITQQEDIIL